jgi:aminomethyltransferase
MGRLSFAGAQALDLIQKVWTNNAATMKDFQVRYGLICKEDGGTLDDVLVYRWPYGWAMVVNASNREKILGWLNRHKAGLDVQVQDQTPDTAMIAVQGPKALALCAGMFEADPARLKYYFATPTRYKGKGCVVSRTGYTGEDGLEVMVSKAQAVELADDLVSRGAVPCGLGARDTLRLEAGMNLYGQDMDEGVSPLDAGLAWTVDLASPRDFVGKEALRSAGQQREFLGLVLTEAGGVLRSHQHTEDDRGAGEVTSGTFSPTLSRSIALARLPRGTAPGDTVRVRIRDKALAAKVVKPPFVRNGKVLVN